MLTYLLRCMPHRNFAFDSRNKRGGLNVACWNINVRNRGPIIPCLCTFPGLFGLFTCQVWDAGAKGTFMKMLA